MNIRHFDNRQPEIANSVYVDLAAVVIGRVMLGADVSIWPMAVLRGDINAIHVGARTNIQDGSILHVVHDYSYCPGGLETVIGEDTTVGHGVILHGCTIGSSCLIGMNTTVLDGAVIQDQVIVGANSLVPPKKVLERGYLYFGNPVKQVRPLTLQEAEQVKANAILYVELKNKYLQSAK